MMPLVSRLLQGRSRSVGATPATEVVRENKWRLLRYLPRPGGAVQKTPVLLVPSLINRHYVLDLLPGRSLAEYLVAEGHDVFIIDWGTPGPEDRYLELDTIADRYLGRAVRATARAAGAEKVHLLGYCLGGTLTAIYAAARPAQVASLIALAAPIRFTDDGLLSLWTRTKSFDVSTVVRACGNMPWQLMQLSFELLKPTLNVVKGVQLLERAWDDQFLDAFWAIETWGHDNVSFPGRAYERYVEELYRSDALVKDAFTLSGSPVLLRNITCPTLAVTFQHDHIVPEPSATVLLERIGAEDKQHLSLAGGHVGAVISQKASKTLWPALSQFWRAHELPPSAPSAKAPPARPPTTPPEPPRSRPRETSSS
ncbi:MAG: alpha/beta fold hydrolase [Myxococcota bacterium]